MIAIFDDMIMQVESVTKVANDSCNVVGLDATIKQNLINET